MRRPSLKKLDETIVQFSLPFRGQVGAGTAVPFIPRGEVLLLLPIKYQNPIYSIYQTCGDSFIGEGILDGDLLVCREKFETEEVKDKRLVIVKDPFQDLMLKRIYFLPDLRVKLCSANRKYKPQFYDLELIEVVALVDVSYREHEQTGE